jgi:hypothetical protein
MELGLAVHSLSPISLAVSLVASDETEKGAAVQVLLLADEACSASDSLPPHCT